jgi:ketosteroid isomerase-like protein
LSHGGKGAIIRQTAGEKHMRAILSAIAILLPTAAWAAGGASAVIDHHVAMMKKGDLTGVMADYADNAVVMTPHGVAPGQTEVSGADVFAGKANARKLFAVLTDKDHVPGNMSMETRYETKGDDTTLMHWVQFKGTPKEVSGTDVFVIRGSKVVFQSVLIDAAKH